MKRNEKPKRQTVTNKDLYNIDTSSNINILSKDFDQYKNYNESFIIQE